MVKQYVEYYTKTIEVRDFERFGIYKQAKENILIRQIELEQMILDRGKIDAVTMSELVDTGYLIMNNEGIVLNGWEQIMSCLE